MVFASYVAVTYIISLQGSEVFLLDLEALRDMRDRALEEYFWLDLRGKLKGENLENLYVLPCTKVTPSGINVKGIIWRLIREMEKVGRLYGPAISDAKGEIFEAVEIDQILIEVLEEFLTKT